MKRVEGEQKLIYHGLKMKASIAYLFLTFSKNQEHTTKLKKTHNLFTRKHYILKNKHND